MPPGMSSPDTPPRPAWQPFTFGSVAAFARATGGRTLAVAVAFAILDALLVFGAFELGWLPVLDAAVEALPESGEIRAQELHWNREDATVLAGSRLLQLVVDGNATGAFGHEADLRLELRRSDFRLCGAFGCWTRPYPAGWIVALNRPELVPLWGAWRPFVLWGVFLGTAVALLASWIGLATAGAIPLRLAAFYADREVTLMGCWRLLVAALLPGGLLLGTAVFFYGLRGLSTIELLAYFLLHFVIGAVYASGALRRLPEVVVTATVPPINPFRAAPEVANNPIPPAKPGA